MDKQLTDNEQWREVDQVPTEDLFRGKWAAFNAWNNSIGYGPIFKEGISHTCYIASISLYNVTHVKRILPPDQPQKAS